MNMIKRNTLLVFATISVLAIGFAAQVGAVDVTAQATITAPSLSVSATSPLDFGSIVASTNANTITIDATAGAVVAPVVTGFGSAVVTGGGSGAIDVVTNVDANVTINCSEVYGSNSAAGADDEILAIFGGGDDSTSGYQQDALALTKAVVNANTTVSPLSATAGPAGTNTINVGGVISVSNALQSGAYVGTLVFDVAYQ